MEAKLSRTISISAAMITMLLGILVIIGWLIHNDFLRSVVPGAVKMKFNVALNFIFSATVLLLYHFWNINKAHRLVTVFLCLLISLTGILTLSEYIFGVNLGIDEFFVRDELRTTATYYAGRMSPISALNFLLIGIGLLCLNKQKSEGYQFFYLFEIAFIALLMLFSFNFVTDIPTYFRLSIHVAIGFIVLPMAIYFAQPMLQERVNFEYLMLAGFIAVISLTLVISVYSIYYNAELIDSSRLVEHTHKVIHETDKTLSLAKDIENNARAYVMFNDSTYLEHAVNAGNNIFSAVKSSQKLTTDNPSQQVRIDSLSALISKQIDFSNRLVQLRKKEGFEAAYRMIMTLKGRMFTDQITKLTAEIQQNENSLLAERQKKNIASISAFNYAFRTLLIFLIILLVAIFFIIRYNLMKRKKAEKQSKESEEQIQSIFKFAPDAVITMDGNGRIANWNPKAETLFGWSAEEVIGKPLSDIIIPRRYRDAHKHGLLHFIHSGEGPLLNKQVEVQALHKNGNEVDIALSISPTMVKEKHLFVGFVRDITEQKAAQERIILLNADLTQNNDKLEAANKELDAFSYSVSHDLRAPLRAIHGYTKMLSEDYVDKFDDDAKQMMDAVLRNAGKMGRLIDELLAFSRLGKKNLQITTLDMTKLATTVVNDIRYSLRTIKANIVILPLHPANGDAGLVSQVFANLISNAIKYSGLKDSPEIEIGWRKEDSKPIYYVKDNGVGFDMRYYDKLFGVFQRLHRDEEFEGTGVGLALVRRIITRHGGNVWAEAEIDKGATFYFSLNNNE